MGMPKAKAQISGTTTVTAPTGGLNAYNPISSMPETDAIMMRNFFPEPYGCRVRKGYVQHAIGLDGDVCSLLQYNKVDGTSIVFAVDQSSVIDVTTPGDYTANTPLCASTNPWWQSTNFANPAGVHMIAFNGVDDGILYSPNGLHRLVAGNGTTAYTWSGVDPADLVVPVIHQHRVWAVEKGSTKAWYLPPEQVWGIAKSFDFGANFSRGGFLQALAVYTQDNGDGPDDYLAAISSSGELAVYKGINPDDTLGWGLVGVFYIGSTFTRRCVTRFGGDVAVLTQYGMITIGSVAKPSGTSVLANSLSIKIQHLISQVVTEGSQRAGWQMILYPAANFMLINVPGLTASQNLQLVFNTITNAWSQFTGMEANCWTTIYDSLMFGGFGKLYRAWEGNLDDVDLNNANGRAVVAEVQQAFSYFGLPGANKHFKMFRPTFVFGGKFSYKAGANMDFDFATQPPPASFGISNFGAWDISYWDTDAVWAGGGQSSKQWVSITGIGYAGSIRMVVETTSETIWASTDWVMEKGGVV